MNSDFLPEALGLPDLVRVFAAVEHFTCPCCREAGFRGKVDEHVGRADVPAVAVIGLQQHALQRALRAGRPLCGGEEEQPMRIERVPNV